MVILPKKYPASYPSGHTHFRTAQKNKSLSGLVFSDGV